MDKLKKFSLRKMNGVSRPNPSQTEGPVTSAQPTKDSSPTIIKGSNKDQARSLVPTPSVSFENDSDGTDSTQTASDETTSMQPDTLSDLPSPKPTLFGNVPATGAKSKLGPKTIERRRKRREARKSIMLYIDSVRELQITVCVVL